MVGVFMSGYLGSFFGQLFFGLANPLDWNDLFVGSS